MSSPDVFRSSPMRAARQFNSEVVHSSSPDLPSIRDLASQIPRRPPLRSGSKAKPIPEGATSTFTSAKEQWKSVQAAAEKDEPTDPVVEVAPEPSHKPKRARKKPVRAKKTNAAAEASREPREPSVDEPWRKYKTSPKSKSNGGSADGEANVKQLEEGKQEAWAGVKTRKETGVMSEHFQSHPDAAPRPAKKPDNEPLQLEPATERRVDWTPPAAKTASIIDIASDAPGMDDNTSSVSQAQSGVFKTLLETYGCGEQAPQPVTVSDEDSSFLKKRKLVELVSTNDTSRPTSPAPEKSPTKQKAPRKKARTITDLATAAYRPATPNEPEPPASGPEHLPATAEVPGQVNNETKGKGKGKANASKKKAPKKSKKKQPPPKPILLSPSTALKEVSKQDFVFGTSSQLVREQSPTLLRDIQYALKQSAEINGDALSAPLNSDALEPVERQKLWEAGARDEDGQLFDAKIVDLIDDAPETLPLDDDHDPFGYVKADSENKPLPTNANADNSFETLSDIMPSPSRNTATNKCDASPSRLPEHDYTGAAATVDNNSFETLSDVLPDLPQRPPEILDADVPISSSQVSVSTNVPTSKGDAKVQLSSAPPSTTHVTSASEDSAPKAIGSQVQAPKYELYTDVQLSREITSFGFKPVKKRTAMLALLDQCWKSKAALGGTAGARSVTTSAKSTSCSAQSKQLDASPTRPRGRPRKNSGSSKEKSNIAGPPPESPAQPKRKTSKSRASPTKASEQINEPPPSAQPLESPKRGRGRPRKNSPSPSLSSPSKPVTKKPRASKKTASRPKTPTKKPTVSKTVVEIPDSASEDGSRSSVSRSPSPEQTFSPPPEVDLSVSMEEDTELSLSMTPDEKEEALYNSLTAAITSAPRSTDPTNPSWYEKILLYDPIVLEDITSWLNSGQLTRVGYDGEVSPGEVKKWCESKSVCCLWRVNLRGKERKRY